jgi:excisionase family DNA binding protein
VLQELLTAQQLAELLKKHPRTILRMAQSGELPHVRIGERGIRFVPSEIQDWLAERRVPA